MIRPDTELHEIEVFKWTDEESFWHLRTTFDRACKYFPEVMEPYLSRSAGIEGRSEAKDFMRMALRETFKQRR